ncbi:amino acid ABC transporter permease [Campylobacter pinnipediorum]|uniref:amino acid ABC transporter permease n=1 Tax=Campylobacter pinnipediorum TaxID=1965231 RepID=UPI00099509C2|nr:amino acid ABC transporter permease [Campylobacter pinnipediorum]AQW82932.1 pathogenesis-associated glutamine ABC transporter, permease protein [Campylobacter pinnipediorum subsp. pinnipediorum]
MDIEFILKFYPMYIEAGILTIKLAFLGIFFSIIIGIFCVAIRFYNIKFALPIITSYVELSRNTPLLIQLFFIYYGLPKLGINIDNFTCAVIGLAFLGGSYMAESFRLGYEEVRKSQIEAGFSLGLNNIQILYHIITPQAFTISLPSISANIIFLLKETSIVSIIALGDLVYVAKDLIGLYYKTDEALFMLVISYLIIILPISLFLGFIERIARAR